MQELTKEEAEINLKKCIKAAKNGLKNFQICTVKEIINHFKNGQNRVLVADEVGLGKTIVAKGVIAELLNIFVKKNSKNNDLFKVVYICSNQGIARQNLDKLNVFGINASDERDSRLSMQNLSIARKDKESKQNKARYQIIPMTPGTSFSLTSGGGIVNERALIYVTFEKSGIFGEGQSRSWFEDNKGNRCYYIDILKNILQNDVSSTTWNGGKNKKGDLILGKIKEYSDIVEEVGCLTSEYFSNFRKVYCESRIGEIKEYLKEFVNKTGKNLTYSKRLFINKFRMEFALLSIRNLSPNLIILDEFQRFPFMLDSSNSIASIEAEELDDEEKERKQIEQLQAELITQFFLKKKNNKESLNVLLLSATPFKLYSTAGEIQNSKESFTEFDKITQFLFNDSDLNKTYERFTENWYAYTDALREINELTDTIIDLKSKAQKSMFSGIFRTERISDKSTIDLIDDKNCKTFTLSLYDVKAYQDACTSFDDPYEYSSRLIEYSKSCPFLLSFMKYYAEKLELEKTSNTKITREKVNKKTLWLDLNKINNYEDILEDCNSRLQTIKNEVFHGNISKFLWLPPSRPYYSFSGAYEGCISEHYSKFLVFSAWEMVPRMLGNLLSYEQERRTSGFIERNMIKSEGDQKQYHYFSTLTPNKKNIEKNRKRYPSSRLVFKTESQRNILTMLYPSKIFANLFTDKINEYLKSHDNIEISYVDDFIKKELREKIRSIIYSEKFKPYLRKDKKEKIDVSWFSMLPILLDTQEAEKWCDSVFKLKEMENSDGNKNKLAKYIDEKVKVISIENMGKMPPEEDLIDVMVNYILGSPAVCLYRAGITDIRQNFLLSYAFVKMFDTTEGTSVIELATTPEVVYDDEIDEREDSEDKKSHTFWKRVLQYCKDGNLQAVIDEYIHLITEGKGIDGTTSDLWFDSFLQAITFKTSSYSVDTYEQFCSRKNGEESKEENDDNYGRRMRAHFSVGYIDGKSETEEGINAKEAIRHSFNSPFWPFVLTTTSIGQEGLDFHNYCRKIVHWNLPSNPVDLEQREGRINRYKCLAIRQNIADRFGYEGLKQTKYTELWNSIFATAAASAKKSDYPSELIPYWCLTKEQLSKDNIRIERYFPMYPASKDIQKYKELTNILDIYRMALGQPHQEELVNRVLKNINEDNTKTEELKKEIKEKLFIDLCPYNHK